MALVSDIVLVQDLTGSFSDDFVNSRVLIPSVVNRLTNPFLAPVFGSDLKFGLASFKDKPISSLGSIGDYVYERNQAFTNSASTINTAYNGFGTKIGGGGDEPESQLDALLSVALDSSIGYRVGSFRVAIIATDASYHQAGDRAIVDPAGTIANNGDGVVQFNEDYAQIAQIKTALEANNIIPVFLATTNVIKTYQGLVTQLGRGSVLSLDSNSENIADAIKEGVARARGVISDGLGTADADFINAASFSSRDGSKIVFGGEGDDSISLSGVTGNHFIDGGAGSDILFGGAGADIIEAGSDDDNLVGGNGNDILFGSSGIDFLTGGLGNDYLQGDSGNDVLTGGMNLDIFAFTTGAKFVLSQLGRDSIQDFAPGMDKIQLSKTTFDALSNSVFPSLLNPADFAPVSTDAAAEFSAAKIVYNSSNGILFYNPNGVAGGFAEGGQFAVFASNPILSAASFEVIV